MNREIKFRQPIFNDKGVFKQWCYWGFLEDGFKGPGHILSGEQTDKLSQQFTGLKDKNGLDIYEGDILRNPIECDWDKANFSCFEVFFHDGDAHADYNIGYTMCRMHNHGSVCGGYIPAFKPKITSKMVVIGNIYQNPELL